MKKIAAVSSINAKRGMKKEKSIITPPITYIKDLFHYSEGEKRLKKGQAVITDLVIAVGLFIIIIIGLMISLNYHSNRLAEDIQFNDMTQKAMYIADTLVFSPGIPYNWTTKSYVLPGLAREERNISYQRLTNFTNMTADQVKNAFKIASYNYTFQMRYQHNNSIVFSAGEFSDNTTSIASSRRQVLYGNETVYLEFLIWTPQ